MSVGHLPFPFTSVGTGLTAVIMEQMGTKKVTFKTTFKLRHEVKSKEQRLQNVLFA